MKRTIIISSVSLFSAMVCGSGQSFYMDDKCSYGSVFTCFTEDLSRNWYRGSLKIIEQQQARLPEGTVWFDFRRSPISGYLIFLAVQFIMNRRQSEVIISENGLRECFLAIANAIGNDLQCRSPEAMKRIGELGNLLLDGEEDYDLYIRDGEILWDVLCWDLVNGRIAFDTAFFLHMAIGMGMNISHDKRVVYVKGPSDSKAIRAIIVPVEDDHFVVALPGGISIRYQVLDIMPPIPFFLASGNSGQSGSVPLRRHDIPLRHITDGDLRVDAASEASYFSLLENCDFYAGICGAMAGIRERLHEDMTLFDLPRFGRCGYWAILAILFARSHSAQLRISLEDCLGLCAAIADRIAQDLQDQDPAAVERIGNLAAVLRDPQGRGGAYGGYVREGEILWQNFFDDMQNGRIPFDYVLLPFVHLVLGFSVFIAEERNIGDIPPEGAVFHFGIDHFMVVLPESVEEIRCQERNEHWWGSLAGMPVAISEDEVPLNPTVAPAIPLDS